MRRGNSRLPPPNVEQPRILNGDDGLCSEVLHQLDLLVGKSTGFLPIDNNCTDQLAVLKHWYPKHGQKAAELHHGDKPRLALDIALFCGDVRNVNHALRSAEAAKHAAWLGVNQGVMPARLRKRCWHVVHGNRAKRVPFAKI